MRPEQNSSAGFDGALFAALDQTLALVITDPTGHISAINSASCRLLGWQKTAMVGVPCPFLKESDGTTDNAAGRALRDGQPWMGRLTHTAEHHPPAWLDITVLPMEAQHGAVLLARDATHEQRGAQSEALRTLNSMMRVMLHEVKTPLAGLSMGLELLSHRLSGQPAHLELVSEARRTLRTLNATLDELARFHRPRSFNAAPVDIGDMVANLLGEAAHEAPWGVVEFHSCSEPCAVCGDVNALKELCTRLLDNAAEATGRQGRILVRTDRDDTQCSITISDHGAGMAPDVAAQAFDPFFTTKHRGLGLGLPVAESIARHHGGSLSLAAAASGGTAAIVKLPLA